MIELIGAQSQPAIDVSHIAPKLWVGSWPYPDIFKHGFDVVVLAAAELQLLTFMEPGTLVKAPLDDDGRTMRHQDIPIALSAAKTISAMRAEGKRVLVTCAQGKNRSALIAALSLMEDGLTAPQAIELVRTKRKLPPGHIALANVGFVSFLRELSTIRAFQKKRMVSAAPGRR